MAAVDWSDLPPELLDTIAKKLTIHLDYIRFRSVCLHWRSSTPPTPLHLPSQLPWLMLPQTHTDHSPHRHSFFNLSGNKFHFLNLPEASHRRRRCGSSHGWLIILEESPAIFLINPFTRAKINLPPLSSFPNVLGFNFYNVGREYSLRSRDGGTYTCNLRGMRDTFVKKVILSSSPSNNRDFVALAILNQNGALAFCKKGDQSWRFIPDAQSHCEDAIHHNGLFYAVNKYGIVATCDVHDCSSSSPRVSIINTPRMTGGDMQYLVASSSGDEIYLVTRYLDFGYDDHLLEIGYHTTQFEVHRLDLSGPNWEKVRHLGDQMIFLGENSSLAVMASDFSGCKGNCIYFTDDYSELNFDGSPGNHDLGIYNLEDGGFEQLPCCPHNPHSRLGWPPPIWVIPNPY